MFPRRPFCFPSSLSLFSRPNSFSNMSVPDAIFFSTRIDVREGPQPFFQFSPFSNPSPVKTPIFRVFPVPHDGCFFVSTLLSKLGLLPPKFSTLSPRNRPKPRMPLLRTHFRLPSNTSYDTPPPPSSRFPCKFPPLPRLTSSNLSPSKFRDQSPLLPNRNSRVGLWEPYCAKIVPHFLNL